MRLAPAVLTLLLVTACTGGTPDPKPTVTLTPSIGGVQVFKGLSAEHADGPIDYPQVPPVGGKHNKQWLACGTYAEAVPAEAAVHSMEHGGIWVTYRPGLPPADAATLGDLQKANTEYVLVSPYPGLPSPVVVSAWGLQMKAERVDDPRILEFVQTYAGGDQGNEEGVPCKKNGLTLEQAKQAVG